jgi:hypothetical protein
MASAVAALDGDPLSLVASASQAAGGGPVEIAATLTNAGAGVAGAAVTAVVTGDDGTSAPVTLEDAGQGRYRGATGALAAGYHLAVVQAQDAGATRTTEATTVPATATPPPAGGTTTPPGGGTTPGGDTPTGGGPPPSGTGTPPRLVLIAGGPTRQSLGRGRLEVTCASKSAGSCRAQATVTVGHHRYRSKVAKATAGARPRTLVLRFAKRTLARIRKALRHGRLKAKVALTLTDRNGATARATVVIRLRR